MLICVSSYKRCCNVALGDWIEDFGLLVDKTKAVDTLLLTLNLFSLDDKRFEQACLRIATQGMHLSQPVLSLASNVW